MLSHYFEHARLNMIASQLRPCDILDKEVLNALSTVPREMFLSDDRKPSAYIDASLEVAENRYLLSPAITGALLKAANISKKDHVLDAVCGAGYSTALLAQLAGKVTAVEHSSNLCSKTNLTLNNLGITNAAVVSGSVIEGCSEGAPYDVIMIYGGCTDIPHNLLTQLAEGGKLVTVLYAKNSPVGNITVIERCHDQFGKRYIGSAHAPLLREFSPVSYTDFRF